MRKRVYILGAIFGTIIPFVGVFLGLQVSTLLGNILAFPLIAMVFITGVPFGMMSPVFLLLAVVLSIVTWTAIFAVIDKFVR